MDTPGKLSAPFRIDDGRGFRLEDYDPGATDGHITKDQSDEELQAGVAEIARLQSLLWAQDRWALLLIFQAMDAGGKDSAIKHVMSGVNPQGCEVTAFRQPSQEELDHDYLWRATRKLPRRGLIGIFNRSYYEEVLVVRVHPAILEKQRLPVKTEGKKLWQTRYDDINAFERHLWHNGTTVLKFFLNVSKEEQRRRFIDRLTDEDKLWKFSMGDLVERGYWKQYQAAYDEMIRATSTTWAPWYVVPADNKWKMRAIVSHVICETIGRLDLKFPTVSPAQRKEMKRALAKLRKETN